MRKRLRVPISVCVACCIALVGCNSAKTTSEKSEAQKSPAAKGDAAKEVHAALDEAIQAIEKKDMKTFIVKFMPVDQYREKRNGLGGIDVAADMMQRQPKKAKAWLAKLRGARKAEPRFNVGKTVATFTVTMTAAEPIKAGDVPLLRKDGPKPGDQIPGYGDDVAAAIKKAVIDLEAGKVGAYLKHMLPTSEIRINDLAELESRFKNSAALKQTIHDLKLMQSQQPDMEENGKVAVFRLPTTGPAYDNGEFLKDKKTHKRTVKLQKVSVNWRLFDNTSAMQTDLAKYAGKASKITDTVSLEKIGDNWRLFDSDADDERRGSRRRNYGKSTSLKSAVGYPEPKEPIDDPEHDLLELRSDKTEAKTSDKKLP